jgi:hypothetical protein
MIRLVTRGHGPSLFSATKSIALLFIFHPVTHSAVQCRARPFLALKKHSYDKASLPNCLPRLLDTDLSSVYPAASACQAVRDGGAVRVRLYLRFSAVEVVAKQSAFLFHGVNAPLSGMCLGRVGEQPLRFVELMSATGTVLSNNMAGKYRCVSFSIADDCYS